MTTIVEALKSPENYLVLQTTSKRWWLYWNGTAWIVKGVEKGRGKIVLVTEFEEQAVEELLKRDR